VTALAFGAEDCYLATGSSDYSVKVWNVESKSRLKMLSDLEKQIGQLLDGSNTFDRNNSQDASREVEALLEKAKKIIPTKSVSDDECQNYWEQECKDVGTPPGKGGVR
jgi:WD40 repeat protein